MSQGADTWKMGSRHVDLRSGDHSGRSAEKSGQAPPSLVWKLLGRSSQGCLWVNGPFLRWFASPCEPLDPRECTWFVEKVSPWIDDVSSCSQGVFSPLFHLHTNIYQHLWKWLVINPYHYVGIYLLPIYAGFDDLKLVLKSRQQCPHT